MTAALNRRLLVLESLDSGDTAKQLPEVVPDCTTDGELNQFRLHGREVFMESDSAFMDLFVCDKDSNAEHQTGRTGVNCSTQVRDGPIPRTHGNA